MEKRVHLLCNGGAVVRRGEAIRCRGPCTKERFGEVRTGVIGPGFPIDCGPDGSGRSCLSDALPGLQEYTSRSSGIATRAATTRRRSVLGGDWFVTRSSQILVSLEALTSGVGTGHTPG